jgi:uncharacterized sulfatase
MTKGERTNKPVELLDLYPTLIDLCGISVSSRLQGKSLRPLLNDPNAKSWKKPAVTLVWYGRDAWGYSLRTERYRYIEWLEGKAGKELYDHANDSEEVTNLAGHRKHEELVASLSKKLKPFVTLKPNYRSE